MKTAFKAKIIFETTKMSDYVFDQGNKEREFTFLKFMQMINNKNKIDIECILDGYTNQQEPVLIIKQK